MKKIFFTAFIFMLFSSCNSLKFRKEFHLAKTNNEIVLVFNEINSVEKKKAINVLVSKYLNDAPNDQELTKLITQHIKYYLDVKGFKTIVSKQAFISGQQSKELNYEVAFEQLLLREYKKSEYVTDQESGTSDKVKLKGIETEISGSISLLKNKLPIEGTLKKIKASERKTENHSGEFIHTKNLKEYVLNESGSVKYLSEINDLEGGVFQDLCITVAEKISEEINSTTLKIFLKHKRALNKNRNE